MYLRNYGVIHFTVIPRLLYCNTTSFTYVELAYIPFEICVHIDTIIATPLSRLSILKIDRSLPMFVKVGIKSIIAPDPCLLCYSHYEQPIRGEVDYTKNILICCF